ncbi:MAG: SCP2 sterol-binding domain-containing protein [Promethearchaeota archaeon]
MVDAELLKKLAESRDKGQAEPRDALILYEVFKQIAQEDEDIKEELEDLDTIVVQNNYTDTDFKYWVKLGEGKFEYGEGEAEEPTVTMSATAATWTGLGSGEIDSTSAYMSGDLSIEGNLQDAIAYGEILGMFRDFLEDLEG